MNFALSPAAGRDFDRLYDFLLRENPAAAARAMRRVWSAIRALREFPRRGRLLPDGNRELIVRFGRAGYVAHYLYLPEQDKVVILRVWHSRENRI